MERVGIVRKRRDGARPRSARSRADHGRLAARAALVQQELVRFGRRAGVAVRVPRTERESTRPGRRSFLRGGPPRQADAARVIRTRRFGGRRTSRLAAAPPPRVPDAEGSRRRRGRRTSPGHGAAAGARRGGLGNGRLAARATRIGAAAAAGGRGATAATGGRGAAAAAGGRGVRRYAKFHGDLWERKGRENPDEQDDRHQCNVRGVQSKCHRCEVVACGSRNRYRCNYQLQGVAPAELPQNVPTASDSPWAVNGSHRYDFGSDSTTHVCVVTSGGNCTNPLAASFRKCATRCWGWGGGPAVPKEHLEDAESYLPTADNVDTSSRGADRDGGPGRGI